MDSDLLGGIIAYVPLLLFLLVAFFYMGKSQMRADKCMVMNEEILELNRQMATSLKEIEMLLENRKP